MELLLQSKIHQALYNYDFYDHKAFNKEVGSQIISKKRKLIELW